MVTLQQALETAGELPPEQQEMLENILRQRRNDQWRKEVAAEAQSSAAAFHAGRLKAESALDVISSLRLQLNDASE